MHGHGNQASAAGIGQQCRSYLTSMILFCTRNTPTGLTSAIQGPLCEMRGTPYPLTRQAWDGLAGVA